MPNYPHECQKCDHFWEKFYSINKPIPDECPNCGANGFVKRLIVGAPAAKVLLSGKELNAKIASERKEITKTIADDEKKYANIVGEEKYQKMLTEKERIDKRYKKQY